MAGKTHDDEVATKAFDSQLTKRALEFMLPYRQLFLFALVMLVITAATNVAKPFLFKIAIDDGISQGNVTVLTGTAAAYILLYVFRWGIQYMQAVSLAALSQNVTNNIRNSLFRHIQSLSLDFFNKREVGRIISRLMGDVASLDALITSGAIALITNIFTTIGVAFVMLKMNWSLTLLTFTLLPVIGFITVVLRAKVRKMHREVRAKAATVTAAVAENVSGVRVVKSFARERDTLLKFKRKNRSSSNAVMRSIILSSTFSSLIEFATIIGLAIVFWYGGMQVAWGQLTIGGFVAFLAYIGLFYTPVTAMGEFYAVLQAAMAGAERIFEILDTKPDIIDRKNALNLPPLHGKVEFKDVHFGYDETPILKGINFTANAGETVAIVGPTGAGKTTIVSLIARQYDVTGGAILTDDIDIRNVTIKSLRSQMGVVLQECFLFPGTIRENIRYGRLNATDAEVEAAAKAVGAHNFIINMQKGYDTQINEGGWELSTGQKQILSFTRALLADPRILVLDEATSSVDTKTEQEVQAALGKLLEGRTAFVVAHRLSTITEADKIILMRDGVIAESGNHNELLKKGGLYSNLFHAQFEGWT
jgi:ATP-binding cassette subfamily B multidrug efflux pump